MNIIPAEWIVQRSPGSSGSKDSVMDVKCWKDIVGQSVGPHHRSLMRSRWHNSLSFSLSSSGRVYQRCPEYLTGKRAHPWDLICTGVHLVEVVWDNLHIMSHLHPGFMKMAHWLQAECAALAVWRAEGLFADTVAKASVCCANPRGS